MDVLVDCPNKFHFLHGLPLTLNFATYKNIATISWNRLKSFMVGQNDLGFSV